MPEDANRGSRYHTRRRVLEATGATALGGVGLAGCVGDDDGGDVAGTVQVGVLQPLTGDLEYYGLQSLWGFLSGLAYKADGEPAAVESAGQETVEVGETTYELYVEDTQFDPDQAQSVATDLVEDQGVDVLFGTSSSGSARQVIDTVAVPSETPFLAGPAAAADITADEEYCDELVFRASENTAMDARSGGRYVAQETDVERVYIMAADYSFGQAVAQNYQSVLEEQGVSVVGVDFVPQGYSEFEGHFENAVAEDADAVVGGFTVSTLPAFLSTGLAGGYGLRMFGGFATRISTAAVGQVALNVLGDPLTEEAIQDAELGPFTTRYHWNQYDNEINDWFVDEYTNVYGTLPDLFTSGTFAAASSLVQGVRESESTDGADVADALRGMTIAETPKGEDAYTYQEYNNQARSSMTIANPVPTEDQWTENWDAPIQPSEPVATIGADEVTLPADHEDVTCDLG